MERNVITNTDKKEHLQTRHKRVYTINKTISTIYKGHACINNENNNKKDLCVECNANNHEKNQNGAILKIHRRNDTTTTQHCKQSQSSIVCFLNLPFAKYLRELFIDNLCY